MLVAPGAAAGAFPALGRGVPELLLVIVPVPGGQPGSALWEHRDVLLPLQMLVTPFLKELGVFSRGNYSAEKV